jgi:hypothetical protein
MHLLAIVLAVPALLVGWLWWSDHSLEKKLQPVATAIAGRDVKVDCQSFWGGLLDAQGREGEVRFDAAGTPEPKLFMTHNTCGQLRHFAGHSHHGALDCLTQIDWRSSDPLPYESSCYASAAKTIYSVLVLAHESYHTAGVTDEAAANCFAIQAMAWTAVQLHASEGEAERLALATAALEPEQDPPYGTSDCHAGGRLDLNPATPEFPTEHPLAPPRSIGGTLALVAAQ